MAVEFESNQDVKNGCRFRFTAGIGAVVTTCSSYPKWASLHPGADALKRAAAIVGG